MGKSRNQAVRDYLEQLAGSTRRGEQWAQFEARCLQSPAKLNGWRFNRDRLTSIFLRIRLAGVPSSQLPPQLAICRTVGAAGSTASSCAKGHPP